ncbi:MULTISPECIES: YqaJ viral recombinase family protein [Gordonibacter]|uniref:YqaJ viral recombinase family protein n=1 Tax=Gordonibacter faecis TaxID=3047475 RepID=A0ABT7DQ43_9ACTN|nr:MULTISPECIES: YqaJ viral recombinase family protein [unclassified Gordonibacter]MDJ1651653.1 YqaJ viral recombinase family protein [Gordonibacter sp. KGMB12511]HIW77077.1 YqaJ viral recombinase family protein [Candidatus Gordonibacter avicola]
MKPFTEVRFSGTDDEVRQQWLARRKHGIGGSDSAAILGMSPYSTPLTVWLEKTGRIEPPDLSEKESVHWGNMLEDVVAREFASRHTDMKVRRKNAILVSKEHPFMFASVDRLVTDADGRTGVLEIKTAGAMREHDWDDGIPEYYLPQPTHYLAVTGYEFFCVAVLIGGQKYREFRVERDDEDISALIEAEKRFWRMVEDDVMPATTCSEADTDALTHINCDPSDEYLDMLDDDAPQIRQISEVSEQIKRLEKEKRQLGNELKQMIGSAKGIQTPTMKITWVRSNKTSFDTKRFKQEKPDEYTKYVKCNPSDGGLRMSERS